MDSTLKTFPLFCGNPRGLDSIAPFMEREMKPFGVTRPADYTIWIEPCVAAGDRQKVGASLPPLPPAHRFRSRAVAGVERQPLQASPPVSHSLPFRVRFQLPGLTQRKSSQRRNCGDHPQGANAESSRTWWPSSRRGTGQTYLKSLLPPRRRWDWKREK